VFKVKPHIVVKKLAEEPK